MDREGWPQRRIARSLGISQPQVSVYLSQIRAEYREMATINFEEAVAEKLQQYRDVRRAAWIAYRRSSEDHESVVEHYGLDEDEDGATIEGSEKLLKKIKTREGRLPLNQYLGTVMATLEAERALLGLDEQPPGGGVNLTLEANLSTLLDEIEKRRGLRTRPVEALPPKHEATGRK